MYFKYGIREIKEEKNHSMFVLWWELTLTNFSLQFKVTVHHCEEVGAGSADNGHVISAIQTRAT